MTQSRRNFLASSAATVASGAMISVYPFAAKAAGHSGDMFETSAGPIKVHPIRHASVIMETPAGVIYIDPVGEPNLYESRPVPDLVLITHEHGDHFNAGTLAGVMQDSTQLITNPAVFEMLPDALKAKATAIANDEGTAFGDATVDAIPAYNLTEERKNFHPKGRDNGYVLTLSDFRVYVSGDTEDIPEMRALTDIDLAFVSMNLPFTMSASSAADAVREFAPKNVYPYHYRGRDGGTQDPKEFAELVGDASTVQLRGWY